MIITKKRARLMAIPTAAVIIALAVIMGVGRADRRNHQAHMGWNKAVGTITVGPNRYGSTAPEYQLASVTYRNRDRGEQTKVPVLVYPQLWQTGDQLQMWYSDLGVPYIPAAIGSGAGQSPFPNVNVIISEFIVAGLLAAVVVWYLLSVVAVWMGSGGFRRKLVAPVS